MQQSCIAVILGSYATQLHSLSITIMTFKLNPIAYAVSLTCLSLSTSQSAFSQTTLPPITVVGSADYAPDVGVATRSETPAREVPFSVSSVGRTLLSDRGVTTMNDALRTVPGVAAITGIGNANARYRFRGFLASSQLKDGFRQQVNFPVTEFQNVETLEVMRGPASSLYGRFEPGGVLNIVTKRPGVETRNLAVSAGDDGQRRLTVDLGGKVGQGFGYRVNAAIEDSETYRDYVGQNMKFLAPALQWKLGSATTIDFKGEWLDRDSVFDRGFPLVTNVPIRSLPADRFLGDPADRFDNQTYLAQVQVNHRFANGLKLTAGYSGSKGSSLGDYFFPVGTTPLISATGNLSRRNQITTDINEDRTAMVELRGKASLLGFEHQWLVGIEQNRSVDDSKITRSTVNSLLNINTPVYGAVRSPVTAAITNSIARNDTTAVYLQNEVSFATQWRLTVGVRSESIESTFTDRITNVTRRSDVQATTGRAGLTFMPLKNHVYYLNASQSFSPEVTARGLVGGVDPEPSRGKQIELGARWELLNDRVQVQLSAFDIERTKVRVADTTTPTLDRQVGEQRSKGAELELTGRPMRGLQVVASLGVVEAKTTKDTVALTGKTFSGVPTKSASLWTRYDLHPRLSVAGGVNYVGERFVDASNTFALASYSRWDFALFGPINSQWRWQVNLLNAGNKQYLENGNTAANFYPGMPRTIRASVSVKF
jgi:iron complex outermembrane recepter protein